MTYSKADWQPLAVNLNIDFKSIKKTTAQIVFDLTSSAAHLQSDVSYVAKSPVEI